MISAQISRPGIGRSARNAASLQSELLRRRTHPRVLEYCTLELLKKNDFHAQPEATKSVFDRLRQLTGATGDGAPLVDDVLALGQSGTPRIAISPLGARPNATSRRGSPTSSRGLAGMYRNPVAHAPRLNRTVTDDELLTTLSMIHRRLVRRVGSWVSDSGVQVRAWAPVAQPNFRHGALDTAVVH